ncbi:hypothetical protein M1C57_15840 [Rhodococcus pyridinivorans]|uniref:hypothetical protein n=1 Tax=Rhodococcus pyridinivorans TaxID=103816 RepID=UPI002009DE7B|nr:hypothetical protein [Rhodococcus pyridinivorans]UPW03134.1 hypothetical protein M1C57_15840 [Rhodococcus pyridinivorans]
MTIDASSTAHLHDRTDRLAPKPILRKGGPRLAMSLLVGDSVRPTRAQSRAFTKFAHTCDPVADDLVAAIRRDRLRIRTQFEQALEHGIETVDDSAPEMAAFIATLDGVPFRVDYDKLDLAARAIVRMPMSTLMAFTTAVAFPASYPLRLIWLAVWSAVDPDDSSAALTEAALKAVPCIYGGRRPGCGEPHRSWARYYFHADLARLSLGSGYADVVGVPRLSPMAALYPVWFARNLLRDRLNVLVPGGVGRAARRGHAERMREIAEVKRRLEVRPYERDGAVQSIRERDRELRARSA